MAVGWDRAAPAVGTPTGWNQPARPPAGPMVGISAHAAEHIAVITTHAASLSEGGQVRQFIALPPLEGSSSKWAQQGGQQ